MSVGCLIPGPLANVRVVDASNTAAGAIAAMHLADFGADVVRVESEGHGFGSRGAACWNRNKRVVSADPFTVDRVVADLAAVADVLIADATPSELVRRSLDVLTVRATNESLVHVWLPPTALHGRWAQLPASPILLGGISGTASHQGFGDGPVAFVAPLVETVHGILGACAAVSGLLQVSRTGNPPSRGAIVSGLHAVAALQTVMTVDASNVVRAPVVPGGGLPNFRPYRAADGLWLQLAALSPAFTLETLDLLDAIDVMLLPEVDGEYTNLFRPGPAVAASARMAERFGEQPRSHWLQAEQRIPIAPVESREQWLQSDAVTANGLRVTVHDHSRGEVSMPPLAVTLSDTPGAVRRLAMTAVLDDVGWDRRMSEPQREEQPAEAMPLDGLRVLDLGAFVASPFAGSVLCDLGADVIKVEPPSGDDYRSIGASFIALHQGKRGIIVDLKTADGRKTLHELIAESDVLIHNFRAGARERLGLDAAALHAVNSRLIVCDLSPWGEIGELRDAPAFDPLLQARSGLMSAQGGGDDPVQIRLPIHDTGAACLLTFGALVALLAREHSGRGQRVSTSMAAASLVLQSEAFTDFRDASPLPVGCRSFRGALWSQRFYQCADGWIAVDAGSTEEQAALRTLLTGQPSQGVMSASSLVEALERAFSERSAEAWLHELGVRGVPCSSVLGAHAEYSDSWMAENSYMHVVEDSELGPCTVVRSYSSWPAQDHQRGSAPQLGQHTNEVLEELRARRAEHL